MNQSRKTLLNLVARGHFKDDRSVAYQNKHIEKMIEVKKELGIKWHRLVESDREPRYCVVYAELDPAGDKFHGITEWEGEGCYTLSTSDAMPVTEQEARMLVREANGTIGEDSFYAVLTEQDAIELLFQQQRAVVSRLKSSRHFFDTLIK